MSLLSRSDLAYTYTWKADEGDNAKITGFPDNILLDRNEGYEVLPFINRLAKENGLEKKASGLKIEKMIRANVPTNLHSQRKISDWIKSNWSKY